MSEIQLSNNEPIKSCDSNNDLNNDPKNDLNNDLNNDLDDEVSNTTGIFNDDDGNIFFPHAKIDPKLIQLQKDVTEFVTSVILKHEKDFYQLVKDNFNCQYENILGYTRDYIIEMITKATTKFYNQIYSDIQNKRQTPLTTLVYDMTEYTNYGPHILLDKLFRLTLDAHLDVVREDLVFENMDLYDKSVLCQINIYLSSRNLLHVMSKGVDENGPFVDIPEGNNAFQVTIEKNIGSI